MTTDQPAEASAFDAATEVDGPLTVIRVRGEIDLATAEAFDTVLDRVLRTGPAALVLELSGVDFLGSSGITSLVAFGDRAAGRGIPVAIACGNSQILRIVDLLGLTAKLNLHPTLEAATRSWPGLA